MLQIVHNPGSIPDDNRLYAGADLICVFESPYDQYASQAARLSQLVSSPINGYGRQSYANMVSGLPTNWAESQLAAFINTVKIDAQSLFVTDINIEVADIYGSFGTQWSEFVTIVSQTAAQQY